MGIFRDAVVDRDGQVDVANLGLFWVTVHVLGAIVFVCAMSAWAYARCKTACTFDVVSIGTAVGAICAGYAAALTALGAYVRLDQKRKEPPA